MIKTTINSYTENINQKLKNPFLGTFLIVWIIRNWKFVYALFYFDSELSLDDRITKIKTYFTEYGIVEVLTTIVDRAGIVYHPQRIKLSIVK